MPPGGAEGATLRERRVVGGAPLGGRRGAACRARGGRGDLWAPPWGADGSAACRARVGGGICGRPLGGQTGARLAARGWAGGIRA